MKLDPGPLPWHENIRELCHRGVNAVREGRYDGLRFEVFGYPEKDMVDRGMRDIGPDVPYTTSTVVHPDSRR